MLSKLAEKLWSKYGSRQYAQRWISLLLSLIFFLGVSSSFVWLVVQAEGSRNLYPATVTGFRANLEWRNSFYGNNFIRRQTLLKVYAEAGEFILLGSSAVGIGNGDIRIYNPGTVTGRIGDETIPAIPDFSCEQQRALTSNLNQGRITNRAQELAGPDTITDPISAAPGLDIPNGYVPCFYPAPSAGVYSLVFFGPAGDNSDSQTDPTGDIELTSPNNFNAGQSTTVASWDVTVRSALTATADTTGRLFANYLTLFTGANPRPMSSTFYVLTTDGYIYRTHLRGLDPNAFIVYGNSLGFLDSDGSPLYRDVVASPSGTIQERDQLNTPQGGVSLAPPTHRLFFDQPSSGAILANGIPLTPPEPVVGSIVFNGNLGGNNSTIGAGGTFTYISNITGTFELIISRNGINFDPTNPLNRVLRSLGSTGTQNIIWDGLDNAGNPFTVGTYPVSITVRAGEYHLSLLDVENSLDGGPQFTLLNPPGGVCPFFNGNSPNCSIAFYDDRGYTTASGTNVGTPGVVLPGNGPPSPDRSDPLTGFDTTTNQRRFGDGSDNGFGDKKGLDLWTYVPSRPKSTSLNILARNLAISKTDGGVTTVPDSVVSYTLSYTNSGPSAATGVVITETVPANTIYSAAASAPAIWSCPDGSMAGTICTTNLGLVLSNTTGTVNFAVTTVGLLPAGVTSLTNTALIGDDGISGPDPADDNIASETTPILVIANPRLMKKANTPVARPGDIVEFFITVSNPAPPANTGATNVVVTDPLPLELDLVSHNVSSKPSGIVNLTVVTTKAISTVGHPSGVTQTVASTVTINIPVLGMNEAITLTLKTRVNNLANPAPLTIFNVAVLSSTNGGDDSDEAAVDILPPVAPRNPGEPDPKRPDSLPAEPPREDVPLGLPVPDAPIDLPLPVTRLPETGWAETAQTGRLITGVVPLFVSLLVMGIYARLKRRRLK